MNLALTTELEVRDARREVQDAAEFGRVAVLYGGSSSEREVSLDTGRAVLEAFIHSESPSSLYARSQTSDISMHSPLFFSIFL